MLYKILVIQIYLSRCGFIGLATMATRTRLILKRHHTVAGNNLVKRYASNRFVGGTIKLKAGEFFLAFRQKISVPQALRHFAIDPKIGLLSNKGSSTFCWRRTWPRAQETHFFVDFKMRANRKDNVSPINRRSMPNAPERQRNRAFSPIRSFDSGFPQFAESLRFAPT